MDRLRRWVLERLERPKRHYQQRAYNNLDKLYKVIRPGDVVLVEGRSEMSRIISLFTSSHWSHAALYVGPSRRASAFLADRQQQPHMAPHGDHLLVEAFSGQGVIAAPLRNYEDYNIRICRPYGIGDADRRRVVDQVVAKLGMRYDDQNIVAIALMALASIWHTGGRRSIRACLGNCNDYQVICSGMIAQAFQSVGYPIVPALLPRDRQTSATDNPYGAGLRMRHYTHITPRDFDLSPNFDIIKYNIVGSPRFDYKSLWAEKITP
ncbi:MAG: YiiX/YebB-like N1pC/P60 family cysteine hydrolase [Desulfosarcinaceae bacterium]|nr:YiiX/YebB-like N1pC/P60 family cysteine hydrolase [Desulfosarcinaceae bacterium]